MLNQVVVFVELIVIFDELASCYSLNMLVVFVELVVIFDELASCFVECACFR
jgi:hypothetical protein